MKKKKGDDDATTCFIPSSLPIFTFCAPGVPALLFLTSAHHFSHVFCVDLAIWIECVMLSPLSSSTCAQVSRLLVSRQSFRSIFYLKHRIPVVVTAVSRGDISSTNISTKYCNRRDNNKRNNNWSNSSDDFSITRPAYNVYTSENSLLYNSTPKPPSPFISGLNCNIHRNFVTLKFDPNSADMSESGTIEDQIKAQGDIVRVLKSQKADKAKVGSLFDHLFVSCWCCNFGPFFSVKNMPKMFSAKRVQDFCCCSG